MPICPAIITGGAAQPQIENAPPTFRAAFQVEPQVLEPGVWAEFSADGTSNPHARYTWMFGDGTIAHGQRVRHRFPDAMGTQLDGTGPDGVGGASAGRFRVMLKVDDGKGNQDWAGQDIAVIGRWNEATDMKGSTVLPGLNYQIFPGTWPQLPTFKVETSVRSGTAARLGAAETGGFTRYAAVYDGLINVPTDGGYSFHLMARDGARLVIDGQMVALTGPPFGEVCGSSVNAVRDSLGTIALRAGYHEFHLESLESMSPSSPRLLWTGPGINLSDVPTKALGHRNIAIVVAKSTTKISSIHP